VHSFRITPRAEADLDEIALYTRREHGERQCAIYLGEFEARFGRLRELPVLERACDRIRPGLKSQKQGRHVVFYFHEGVTGVLIVRVLHERMAHEEHDFSSEDV
jgi:toxin ParE1/3/4